MNEELAWAIGDCGHEAKVLTENKLVFVQPVREFFSKKVLTQQVCRVLKKLCLHETLTILSRGKLINSVTCLVI